MLEDIELFRKASRAERAQLREQLLKRIPFVPDVWIEGEESIPLIHVSTGIPCIVVPGGHYNMGLSEEDIEELSDVVEFSSGVIGFIKRQTQMARPVRSVAVRPFICSRESVKPALLTKIFGQQIHNDELTRQEVLRIMQATSLRPPSEVEWEWLARDGRDCAFAFDVLKSEDRHEPLRSSFGVTDLSAPQWMSDSWHDSYAGAPVDSKPWIDAGDEGLKVQRSGFYEYGRQSDEEVVFALAAARFRRIEPASLHLVFEIDQYLTHEMSNLF